MPWPRHMVCSNSRRVCPLSKPIYKRVITAGAQHLGNRYQRNIRLCTHNFTAMGIAAGRTLGLQLEPEAFHQRTHVQGQCLVSNALMLLCTVMACASTSILILGSIIPGPNNIHGHAAEYSISANNPPKVVSGHALITLTIGILSQCAVATVALRSAVSNPTWSSNPIDTAAAWVDAGAISVVPGRCLRSVHDRVQGASPLALSSRQRPTYRAHKEVHTL